MFAIYYRAYINVSCFHTLKGELNMPLCCHFHILRNVGKRNHTMKVLPQLASITN